MSKSPYRSQQTIQEKFEEFHKANPRVYGLLVMFTLATYRAGYRHYGIKSLIERVRWHINIETHDLDGVKLNNNYSSRYARMLNNDARILLNCGECFFQERELKAP